MKIRREYVRRPLKTKSVKLTLIGGEDDYTEYCAGYSAGADCLARFPRFDMYRTPVVLKNPESIDYYANIGAVLALTAAGQIYRLSEAATGSMLTYAGTVGSCRRSTFECHFGNEPAVAVVSGTRITFVTAENYYNRQVPYAIKGACLHMGRIFAADASDSFAVRWSGMDMLDWEQSADGAGYIKLNPERGKIFRTLSFGSKLVVFREFGFDVLNVFGDPRHFAVVHQGSKNVTERLREDTCTVCGSSIYCCSENNIYRYDGEKAEVVKLPDYMQVKNFCAGKAYGGRYVYYYCMAVPTGGGYQLEMDLQNGTFALFACDKKFVWKTDDGFWAWKDNTVYVEKPDGDDWRCVWHSESIDLGSAGVKTLKKIYVDKTDKAQIRIRADGVSRSISGDGEIYVGMSGRDFVFEVVGNGKVNALEAEWEVRA